jgi:multidrug efflux pump
LNSIIDAVLDRARTVVLALFVIFIAGTAAYITLPKEAEPEIVIPMVFTSVRLEGVSPEDAERLLVRPLEQELRSLEGIKTLNATAHEGGANISIEFDAGVDPKLAVQEVREQVDMARGKLPTEAEEPVVAEMKMSRMMPIMVLNIGGNVPERVLYRLVQDLKEKIEGVPGVLEVDVVGDREELLEIVVDPQAMESYGLDQNDIFNFVNRNNRLVAAGALQGEKGRFPIKVPGIIESAQDILTLPIKVDGDRVVHFEDIAEVRRTYKDAESFARLNGNPAVALELVQRAGANVIGTIDEVKALVAAEQPYWPPGMQVVASSDKSKQVRDQLNELTNNVISAVLLVFIIIVGVLGIRNAALVGIAVPGSFLGALMVFGIMNFTINMVTMFALLMAVGLLVDGAIVVTELADRRMAEGIPRKKAYSIAAKRMTWPIIASTATTIAAFLPLLGWPGMMGEFMKFLPITLITVLSMSLLMALLFVPTLGGIIGKPGIASERMRLSLQATEDGDLDDVQGWTGRYIAVLRRSLKHPWMNLGGVLLLLIGIYFAFATYGPGQMMFPPVEPNYANVDIRARGDLSPTEQDELVRRVERRILGMPEIESTYSRTGGSMEGPKDTIGSVRLTLIDWQERRSAEEILQEISQRVADIPGIVIDLRVPQHGPQSGQAIEIEFSSRFVGPLEDAVAKTSAALAKLEGLRNLEDTRSLPGIEWRMEVDRAQAALFGADVTTVGSAIQLVTNGVKVGEYRPDDAEEEIDIRVRFPGGDRSLSRLGELRITTPKGTVPLSNFVTRTPAQAVGNIERTDMRRTLTVSADLAPGYLVKEKVGEIYALLPELGIDPTVAVAFKGGNQDQDEAAEFLSRAMLVALALMAMILVTQFNSIFQAVLILTAVLFSTGGVLLGHMITNTPFGIMMSGVGTIALAGIVVNNNIVLIDTYNYIRRTAATASEAILRTCAQRLRPVMLTTVTTILGLMPMVVGMNIDLINRQISFGGPGAQWWTQMASSVAGGLAFATVLTLLLTPSLLMIQANGSQRWRTFRARRKAQAIMESASESV